MSKHSYSLNKTKKAVSKDIFDIEFLNSKDLALQPINFFSQIESNFEEIPTKTKPISLKGKKNLDKDKNTEKTKRSKKSKDSHKSQKSTNNTNKKYNRKKTRKSDSQIYNSNIIIIHHEDEEENISYRDPIEKEIEKLKKIMSKIADKKKKKEKNSSYS